MSICYHLSGISSKHGSRIIFAIDDLEIISGQLYLLTGPNGVGKSTLLSHLALLAPPASGTLKVYGETVRWDDRTLLRLRQDITLLHQSPYLFDGTVSSNVGYGLKLRGIRGNELADRIEKALDLVGLADFKKRAARELSGGEIQRVALARALGLRTKVLLLDEPFAAVDQTTARNMEELLLTLTTQGTTVVMTSHDPDHTRLPGCNIIRLIAGEQPHTAAGHAALAAESLASPTGWI